MTKELPKAYEPQLYEDGIYKRWEESGFFSPDNIEGEPYAIMMPPPNVTGVLHLGHALENSLMDVMARYQRMQGKKVLLLPGTDHAAVATQARVEKNLVESGMTNPREELGREELLEKIREYSEESKATILTQIRKMGTSADWSRLAYTFDGDRNSSVKTTFKKMYDDGLIYRGYRVVNWSVKGQSTCSDDELVHVDRKATLYTFKYAKDFPITIATTRPETKLGDTAVAVNPDDKRYKKFIGQTFDVNFCGVDLKLKIIADPHVDPEFGTGALGVTPAHSKIDFEMYEKKKAEGDEINLIQVIGADGKMTAQAGDEFVGKTVEEARELVVKKLRADDLMEKEEEIDQNVGTSDRFGDIVEAIPMTQWFVDVNKKIPGRDKSLKELMKEAVSTGLGGDASKKVTITPDRFEKIYYNWIDNLRDWCISRQIWWGHRIPVWYKQGTRNEERGTKITFVRHGESEANVQQICAGHMDTPLTDNGRSSVVGLKEKVDTASIDIVFSSDLVRAKETADLLFEGIHKEIIIDKRLREVDFGDYTGERHDDTDEKRVTGFPNGENYHDVKRRVISFLSDVMDKYSGKHIAIVAHSGTWKVLENILHDVALDYENLKKHATREPMEYILDRLVYCDTEAPEGDGWEQDPDTLDTWFSSGLWTFSTLGWPQKEKFEQMKDFHPTAWMQMGHEILFFWMARMILFSGYLLKDIPFKEVYIHGILRDKDGKKFSKSSGNGIDPLEVIEKYGTDALRWSLLSGITPGNDARFYEEKVEGAQHFVNKLWNIARFIQQTANNEQRTLVNDIERLEAKTLADKWILEELEKIKYRVKNGFDTYNFSFAGEQLRNFTWSELADWYLEIAKIEENKSEILNYILNTILKLWHPFMPFVTEAIWREVYGKNEMLMVEKWPETKEVMERDSVDFLSMQRIITRIRSFRGDYKIEPAKKLNVVISAGDKKEMLEENTEVIKKLARLDDFQIYKSITKPLNSVGFVESGVEVFINIEGVIDFEKEKKRLQAEIDDVSKYVSAQEKKLNNAGFTDKAPAEVVKQEKEKLQIAQDKRTKLQTQFASLN